MLRYNANKGLYMVCGHVPADISATSVISCFVKMV